MLTQRVHFFPGKSPIVLYWKNTVEYLNVSELKKYKMVVKVLLSLMNNPHDMVFKTKGQESDH